MSWTGDLLSLRIPKVPVSRPQPSNGSFTLLGKFFGLATRHFGPELLLVSTCSYQLGKMTQASRISLIAQSCPGRRMAILKIEPIMGTTNFWEALNGHFSGH